MLCPAMHAFRQKEINIRSEKMDKDVPVTVITPDGYRKGKAFPVECQFCDTVYEFTPEDIRELLKKV